ncbi:MAG: hypothetical protein LBC61_02815 [Candidatus Peribacteria bacterium]|nr:hypothetical protein [Candidatus Peribacteria bacterium]
MAFKSDFVNTFIIGLSKFFSISSIYFSSSQTSLLESRKYKIKSAFCKVFVAFSFIFWLNVFKDL